MNTLLPMACSLALALGVSAQEIGTLSPDVPVMREELGASCALDGNTLVVGAESGDPSLLDDGFAYLFDATTGDELRPLVPSGSPTWSFGYAVDIDDGLAIVGTPKWEGSRGAIRVFDVGTGAELHELMIPIASFGDEFGFSVAIQGTEILGGAPGFDTVGNNRGAAYLYDAVTGNLINTYEPSVGFTLGRFGSAVAMDGNLVAVGSPGRAEAGDDAGSVCLFDRATQVALHRLLPSNPMAGARFGGTVTVQGNYVLVGAEGEEVAGLAESGAVYLFHALSGVELLRLVPEVPRAGANFGHTLGLVGPVALVGAPRHDGNGADSGAAYFFDLVHGTQLAELVPGDNEAGDRFGLGLACGPVDSFIGANGFDDRSFGADTGLVYRYRTAAPVGVPLFGTLELLLQGGVLLGVGSLLARRRRRT